jgi:hypothetical protein
LLSGLKNDADKMPDMEKRHSKLMFTFLISLMLYN